MSTDVKLEPQAHDSSDEVIVKVENEAEGGITAASSNFLVELKVEPCPYSPELTPKQGPEFTFEVQLTKIEEMYNHHKTMLESFEEGNTVKNEEAHSPENQIHQPPQGHNMTETKKYNCMKCHRQFNWKTNFRKHTCFSKRRTNITELFERIYRCDICQKQFVQKKSLQHHILSHAELEDERKPHKCTLCERQFSQMFHLNDHMKIHTGEKMHTCQYCSKQFIQLSNLKGHLRIHTGERPFPCDCCSKSFTHKATLVSHLRIHSGIRPFKCEMCDKSFTQKSHLNTHNNMIHRPNKKTYSCSSCRKVCFSKISFTEHSKTHRADKRFQCHICMKQYSSKIYLAKHLLSHPEDSKKNNKPFSCTICMKTFTQKCSLDRHNVKMHREHQHGVEASKI